MSSKFKLLILVSIIFCFFGPRTILAYWECSGAMTTTWQQDTSGCDEFGDNCSYYGPWYEVEVCTGNWDWVEPVTYSRPYNYPDPAYDTPSGPYDTPAAYDTPHYPDPAYGNPAAGDWYPTPQFGILGTYGTPTNPNWPASGPPCGQSGYNYAASYWSCDGGDDVYTTPGQQAVYASPGGAFDYTMINNGNVTVAKVSGNAFAQNTVTRVLLSGSPQSTTLTLTGVPSGVSYAITPNACNPSCSSTITLTVTPIAPTGTHPLTVTGSPLNKQTSFNLIIVGNPMTVSCRADKATISIGQSVTWTGTVSGGTAPYTYSWSGTNVPTSPAPSTNPYSIAYNSGGPKNVVLTVRDANNIQASCPAGYAYVNFSPVFEEF